MPDIRQSFEQAVRDVQSLSERPDNPTLLQLYALYKQSTEGDRQRPQPGFFDLVGHAKSDAWERLRGISCEQAMRRYIELAGRLRD